jgi:hypothetical protein
MNGSFRRSKVCRLEYRIYALKMWFVRLKGREFDESMLRDFWETSGKLDN